MRNQPKTEEQMMELKTPIGALHEAIESSASQRRVNTKGAETSPFLVSSDKCALASKPRNRVLTH